MESQDATQLDLHFLKMRDVLLSQEANTKAELKRVKGNFSQQPSMMQDIRAGRPLELDAILGVVIEIAALTGVPVPTLTDIATCVDLLDRRVREDRVAFRPQPLAGA
jgi:ketopantoate reductase